MQGKEEGMATRPAAPPATPGLLASVEKCAIAARRFMLECASTADVMIENHVMAMMQIA